MSFGTLAQSNVSRLAVSVDLTPLIAKVSPESIAGLLGSSKFWGGVYACLGLASMAWVRKSLKMIRKSDFKHLKEAQECARYQAFKRSDCEIGGIRFYVMGFFLIPARVTVTFSVTVVTMLVTSFLMSFGHRCGILRLRQACTAMSRQLASLGARLTLLFAGFLWISETYDAPHLRDRRNTIVSNHVSWADTYVFLSRVAPSFVAKCEVENAPLIGSIAKSLQCIFVSRGSEVDRDRAMVSIKERQSLLLKGAAIPPLVVFPEGTVTAGHGLIPFKRGAFASRVPVQPVVLSYEMPSRGWIHPSYSTINLGALICLMLCTPFYITNLHWLAPMVAPEDDVDGAQFAEKVRHAMTQVSIPLPNGTNGRLVSEDGTYRDSQELMKMLHPSPAVSTK